MTNELNKLDVNKHKETIEQGNREFAYLPWAWELREIIARLKDIGKTFEDVFSEGDEAELGQAIAHLEYIEKEFRR